MRIYIYIYTYIHIYIYRYIDIQIYMHVHIRERAREGARERERERKRPSHKSHAGKIELRVFDVLWDDGLEVHVFRGLQRIYGNMLPEHGEASLGFGSDNLQSHG